MFIKEADQWKPAGTTNKVQGTYTKGSLSIKANNLFVKEKDTGVEPYILEVELKSIRSSDATIALQHNNSALTVDLYADDTLVSSTTLPVSVAATLQTNIAIGGFLGTKVTLVIRGTDTPGSALNFRPNAFITKILSFGPSFNKLKYPNMTSSVLTSVPTTLPGSIRDLSFAFNGCSAFNQYLPYDTSLITNMGSMFSRATVYNQPLGHFDVRKVTNFGSMFLDAKAYTQSLLSWVLTGSPGKDSFYSGSGLTTSKIPPYLR